MITILPMKTYHDVVTKLSRVVVPWLCYTDQVTELISALLLKDHPEVMISRKALVLFFPVTKLSFCLRNWSCFIFLFWSCWSVKWSFLSRVIHLTDRSNQFVSDMLICIIKWKFAFASVLHFTKCQYPEEWLKVVSRKGYDKFQTVMKDENFSCHLIAWKKILP